MLTLSRFFMLFLLCNATNALHSMNDLPHAWNDDSDAVRHYRETKNLTVRKITRQKKHQGPSSKQRHVKAVKVNNKKTAK